MKLKYVHSKVGAPHVAIVAFGSSTPICLAKRLEDGRFVCVINNNSNSPFSATADRETSTFRTEAEMLYYVKQQIGIQLTLC